MSVNVTVPNLTDATDAGANAVTDAILSALIVVLIITDFASFAFSDSVINLPLILTLPSTTSAT